MSDYSQALKSSDVPGVESDIPVSQSGSYYNSPRSASSKVVFRLVPKAEKRKAITQLDGPGYAVSNIRERRESFIKRFVDVAASASLLIITSPLLAVVWCAVRVTSKGPAILRQVRLTQGGRSFEMYKFRTMCVDAESKSGPVLAKTGDTRITPFGRLLRISRIDELPQLVNVIRGDMSLIGPRPERPEIAQRLRQDLPGFDRRLEVKAGLTGLAQVSSGYSRVHRLISD
jgi:lipopolysaccharide/colanic/teichoic acid biosynthesis glycosyltransferase